MTKKIPISNNVLDSTLAMQALDSANDGITIVNMELSDQPLIYINRAFEKMTGYTREEVIGKNCRFLQDKNNEQKERFIIHNAIEHQENCRVILKNFRKDGSLFWNELSLAPIRDNKNILTYYIGVQKDVTHDIVQKERITYLSEHDDLTGLYNYRGFFNKFDDLLHKAIKQKASVGVGIADIDFFKEINDRYGHVKGNAILSIIGTELLQEFRDDGIVSRFGGDEFCFALILNNDSVKPFYSRLQRVITFTNTALSNSLQISMSAGMAIEKASEDIRIDHMIQVADNIMYENKQLVHLNHLKEE